MAEPAANDYPPERRDSFTLLYGPKGWRWPLFVATDVCRDLFYAFVAVAKGWCGIPLYAFWLLANMSLGRTVLWGVFETFSALLRTWADPQFARDGTVVWVRFKAIWRLVSLVLANLFFALAVYLIISWAWSFVSILRFVIRPLSWLIFTPLSFFRLGPAILPTPSHPIPFRLPANIIPNIDSWAPTIEDVINDANLLGEALPDLFGDAFPLSYEGAVALEDLHSHLVPHWGQELSPILDYTSALLVTIKEAPSSRFHEGKQDLGYKQWVTGWLFWSGHDSLVARSTSLRDTMETRQRNLLTFDEEHLAPIQDRLETFQAYICDIGSRLHAYNISALPEILRSSSHLYLFLEQTGNLAHVQCQIAAYDADMLQVQRKSIQKEHEFLDIGMARIREVVRRISEGAGAVTKADFDAWEGVVMLVAKGWMNFVEEHYYGDQG